MSWEIIRVDFQKIRDNLQLKKIHLQMRMLDQNINLVSRRSRIVTLDRGAHHERSLVVRAFPRNYVAITIRIQHYFESTITQDTFD